MSTITHLPKVGYCSVPHWKKPSVVTQKVEDLKVDLAKQVAKTGERFTIDVEDGIANTLIIWRIF